MSEFWPEAVAAIQRVSLRRGIKHVSKTSETILILGSASSISTIRLATTSGLHLLRIQFSLLPLAVGIVVKEESLSLPVMPGAAEKQR